MLVGVGVFVLVMIRPGSAALLILASIVTLFQRGSLPRKIRNAAAMAATGAVLLVAWAGYNKVRYGDFTMMRMAAINVPFFRLFMMDRLIRPENGPASRALANAIETDLLPREPYRLYGVTLDYSLKAGHRNMLSDLGTMSDRVWGWDSDYEIIKRASREAILSNLAGYAKAVTMTVINTLNEHSYPRAAPWPPRAPTIRCEFACSVREQSFVTGELYRRRSIPTRPLRPAIPIGWSRLPTRAFLRIGRTLRILVSNSAAPKKSVRFRS